MLRKISERRRQRSKGAVFIEAGLIFIVMAFLLMGIFDFAQFLFVHQALVDRARMGARWGAVNDPTDTTSIQNMVLYGQSTVPTGATSGTFGMTSSQVSASTSGSGTDDYRLVVSITNYSYQMISPVIGGTYTGPNIVVSVPLGNF